MNAFETLKFFRCNHCGNQIQMILNSGVPVVCCGEPMQEIIPNTQDGAVEKHVPVVERQGDLVKVNVGSVDHPMADVHYIQWICLHTDKGVYQVPLRPEQAPKAEFLLKDETPIAVYAYCNLHGLWKTDF